MPKEKRPSDFDWVTMRAQCSALNMFGLLQADAQKNTDTMEALATARGTPLGLQCIVNTGSFVVVRRLLVGEIGVRFTLSDDQILVESQGVDVHFSARLTLNNDGECRLLVGEEELDRWQVLRRALEPLFFRIGR
jgi:hypothetical protein